MIKPCFLYVHERLGAVGVLTQLLGSRYCPVTYLSKQLDAVSPGWPPAYAPWQLLPSWWLRQTSLLWDKDSQSESPTLFWLSWSIKKIIGQISTHVMWKLACPARGC
jgi:hypothetical protein